MSTEHDIAESLSDDAFLGGALRILQPERGFRAGIDSVLLAASVPASPEDHVLEAGIGAGVAALCLARRVPGVHVTGLEVQSEMAALARRNAARNDLGASIDIVEGDIAAMPAPILRRSFAHVFFNPPFHRGDDVVPAGERALDIARREGESPLAFWLDASLKRVRPGGTLTLIHRADRLAEVLSLLEGRAGAIRVLPVWPRIRTPAGRVIVHAEKGSRAPLSFLPGLVLHEEDGRYTPGAESILRGGAALPLI